jgi:hypothetical protein
LWFKKECVFLSRKNDEFKRSFFLVIFHPINHLITSKLFSEHQVLKFINPVLVQKSVLFKEILDAHRFSRGYLFIFHPMLVRSFF